MAPMIDQALSNGEIRSFYDDLAADYDAMTSFEQRFVRDRPFFRVFVENNKIKRALDAGCGTGFHSFLLAKLSVDMTAVDVSPAMITKLKEHAAALELNVKATVSNFQSMTEKFKGDFDAVFCMGNTLAHCLTREELQNAMTTFSSLVREQGILFAQIVNFHRILQEKTKIQSVKEAGDKIFVRSYEYCKDWIEFNLLTLTRKNGNLADSMRSIRLRPWTVGELEETLAAAGFTQTAFYGGINMETFSEESSKDIVVLASRSPLHPF